jgi:hypothetical protein
MILCHLQFFMFVFVELVSCYMLKKEHSYKELFVGFRYKKLITIALTGACGQDAAREPDGRQHQPAPAAGPAHPAGAPAHGQHPDAPPLKPVLRSVRCFGRSLADLRFSSIKKINNELCNSVTYM